MASEQAAALKATYRRLRDEALAGPEVTLAAMRRIGEAFATLASEPEGVACEPVTAGGIAGEWLVPARASPEAALLYLHGGGYILGSLASHRRLAGHLAARLGCRVLSLDYRLAPEHPHPAAINDTTRAYRWLLQQQLGAQGVAIAGDSAGGGLCVAALLKLRDEGVPLPAACTPLSPWVDLALTAPSLQTHAERDQLVGSDGLGFMAEQFLQGQDPRDPYASPLHGDLAGLPAMYIQVGAEEALFDDARRLAHRAEAAGVDVRLDCFAEMQHVFQLAAGNMPEADEALERLAGWLRPRIGLA